MSTDSEDLDEDELLQMALKEQAERDTNYQKPLSKSSKPVANYVQPPPNKGSSSASKNPNPRQRNYTKSMDEDDDSEVEMLSISSGDEESSKASTYGGGGGGGKGRSRAKASKDDADSQWAGGEPDSWKRVDESELARRVREMREARAVPVPVVPKVEHKPSALGKKGLANLQSFPRGMECIDPLGLGIIDNRTLKLITDTSDSSPSRERDNINNDLREKLAYFSEKFDAKLFLSRIHQDTSAADLEAGAHAIKTDLKGRTQQRKNLVKENFDCFVSCKTTIDDIESKLKRFEEDPEGAGTMHLYNIIQGVSSHATRAFEPLFERQAQAEKIRSVQGMLQRFRTLFNLPSTIRASISNGEHDLAVREYKKAKSIALPSHIGILKRVLEEVEKVMHEFKGTLYKTMEDPQIDLTDLENTVRLLLELEPESDPVWHYLNLQNQRIRGLLEKCTYDYEARLDALQNDIRERAASDAKWKQILQGPSQSPDTNGIADLAGDAPSVELTGEEVDALKKKYIQKLTSVLIHYLPAFWKIALSVFSGKFAKSSHVATESNATTSNKIDEKVGDAKYSSHSLDEVSGMMRSTISLYEDKVLDTFREFEESNILRPYMCDSIKEVSKACQALEVKESAPAIIVMALRAVHAEVSKTYIMRLCSWMRTTIEDLSRDETWVAVSIIERNKSPYRISYLPLAFRSITISALNQVSQMLQTLKSEAAKTEDIFIPFHEIQESVRLSALNCFLDFAGHLERIGTELTQSRSNRESSYLPNGHSFENSEMSLDLMPGSVVDPHQQLLMVLSNVGYCKDELCYELYNKYKHIWSHSRERDEEDSDKVDLVMAFSALEDKVLEQYTFAKANMIRTAAMSYLLDAGVQWGSAPSVKGVRDAAVELLHTLVAVHAEVFAGAKPLLDKTLGVLVEGLIDTLLSIFHEYESKEFKSVDSNGFCQLMLELEYFETVLNPYFTNDARESLKSLQGMLLEKATESVTEVVENPGHHRRSTRGGEDALVDERQQGVSVSPDDLIALAQQCSSELLEAELERTRINTACFAESLPLDSVPESAKSAYASFRGSLDSPSKNYKGAQVVSSPSISKHRRR
ncbi:exocyst complex component SEC5A-like [Chenopodium quinoa]|uniref:exocyst complex component SEC5A-like n=1 Tax=Chenopodium quinoa TaxID=63459 RepID=UPI000B7908A2|nr:exocyst complex component SEC5A-like [Chenopodium quinoa]XP_021771597.1 exocyst complex component SEC5A-like [Chenopodium quinoa]